MKWHEYVCEKCENLKPFINKRNIYLFNKGLINKADLQSEEMQDIDKGVETVALTVKVLSG